MTDQNNRIFFKGNPFPSGHRVKKFTWSGELDPDKGLIFHFHLETEDYSAEDDSENFDEDLPDWLSKTVWNNYHKCTLSSRAWHQDGIIITVSERKFSFSHLDKLTLIADPFPLDQDWNPEELAFGIYLLGHDSCADHKIEILRMTGNEFRINWTGKIALTYSGHYEFEYEFEAHLNNVLFDGIFYPKEYTKEQAQALLANVVTDAGQYEFVDLNPKSFKREYKLVPKVYVA